MQLTLIGLGGGNLNSITSEALDALNKAELIIGASRLLESLKKQYKAVFVSAIKAEDILNSIKASDAEYICVVYSGDSGFYSGTRSLVPLLNSEGIDCLVLPGISSVQLLSSAIKRPWQEWNLFSAHGVNLCAVNAVMKGKPAFFLTDTVLSPKVLCQQLVDAGLGDLNVVVGEKLSYEDQRITEAKASEAASLDFAPLSVMLVEPAPKGTRNVPGISDDDFVRGKVPMTKREVRASILSHLQLNEKDIVWDVGAGTGSVSIEMALSCKDGKVYAIECNEEGCELIDINKKKFGAWNLQIIKGYAPGALLDLEAPDAVFIGGTKNNMKEILEIIIEKNPSARICVSAIALETLQAAMNCFNDLGIPADITSIQTSRADLIGSLHLMKANNPIYLIAGSKK